MEPTFGLDPSDMKEVPWVHTPFEQPWWLQAVAPGRWGAVVVHRDGEVAARLPYVIKERLGVRVLTQAPLTRFLGPWVQHSDGKPTHQLALEKDLMSELISRLPSFDAYRADFAPQVRNWLPFYWAGFEATVRYTYRIDGLDDIGAVWASLEKDVRKVVRRAQRTLTVRTDIDLDDILRIQDKLFRRKGLRTPFSDDLARRLDRACAARGARTIVGAVDTQDRVHAAAYTVHDETTTYLLYSGQDPDLAETGAYRLVRWEAIRSAAETTRRFDFLGSMMEPIERVNRSFGGLPVPYLSVSRERPRARAARATARAARRAVMGARGRRR